jgi:hypothetical protein
MKMGKPSTFNLRPSTPNGFRSRALRRFDGGWWELNVEGFFLCGDFK